METSGVLTFVSFLLGVSTIHAEVLWHNAHHDCTVQKVQFDARKKTIENGEYNRNGQRIFELSVDYTMKSSSATLASGLLISHDNFTQHELFTSVLENACENTQCPVEAGKPATYTEIVHLPEWADKVTTNWNVLLHLKSRDEQGPKCGVTARSFD